MVISANQNFVFIVFFVVLKLTLNYLLSGSRRIRLPSVFESSSAAFEFDFRIGQGSRKLPDRHADASHPADKVRKRERDVKRELRTETDRDRQRQTETDRDRQRQTETDRDRQRDSLRQRQE